jgi:hypothetical protein
LLGVARVFMLSPRAYASRSSHVRRQPHCSWLCRRRRECVNVGRHCHACG